MQKIFWLLFLASPFLIQAQQNQILDVQRISGTVHLLPETESVKGKLQVEFKILQSTDTIYLDAVKMKVELAKKSKFKPELISAANKIYLIENFKADKTYTVEFTYESKPQKALYFVGWDNDGSNQIWTQGQGKYTSNWLPSLDDVNDKIEFDLSYQVPENYEVVANGKLTSTEKKGKEQVWKFDMQHPMSSYLVAVAVGDFKVKEITSASGIPIQLYYEAQDENKVESTYKHTQQIFDFFEEEIGVAFPWQNYKQIPVRDFLYAGMENTTATIFSDMFMVDQIGFVDRNYVNVNAHELAHQWFGDMVTEKSGTHHWLQEGFATYYALLAEREIFGEDYFYFQLYQNAEKLKDLSDSGKGEALKNPKASSLTFYQKGAWALHILREKIGDQAFKSGVKNYLNKYAFKNVETEDFLSEMEKVSGMDLIQFKEDWLEQSAFKSSQALASLRKSEFINEYLSLIALRSYSIDEKYESLNKALDFPVNEYLGQEVVAQLSKEKTEEVIQLYRKAFNTNNLLVRQAISTYLKEIPQSLQKKYETLLNDRSYLTLEQALFNLWQNFPEQRSEYLEKLKNIEGFSNKNVRLLWLTLSLVTPEFQPENNSKLYQELSGYTTSKYAYEIRQNTFGFLYQIESFTKQNYLDLMQGSVHPVWRFRNFCRELLTKLASKEKHRAILYSLKNKASAKQEKILTKILEE
ncbi:M1 family metallopeptidase [Mesonia aestuariivivens]|uniref:M1 family metallopeptidase n=1 Tax=Mesonia aestuariivivens TaxID=2796128 RepID=A0ABS6W0E4_9FLAO|nr:M1 family metallopeptidase [Mesonia aestuariivivens]MBW2961328.1 M1 family metallopeptidase [Mesonia aestuariivivens]